MRVRSTFGAAVVAVLPVVALTSTAGADHINNGFGSESRAPGSALVQSAPAPVVIQPGQSVVIQPGQSGSVVIQPGQSGAVVVQPGTTGTIVAPAPQMVQAEDLEANEVRAQTIYANKIQASEIRGAIHQTGKVKLESSVTDLRTPTVVASVLYADTIKAHRVIADHIFVRELERR